MLNIIKKLLITVGIYNPALLLEGSYSSNAKTLLDTSDIVFLFYDKEDNEIGLARFIK